MNADGGDVAVEMRGITKRFGGVLALDHVDLRLPRGKILALVGDNGAGKSTLMKILTGYYPADDGEISLNGQRERIATPQHARRLGIGMVYQDLAMVDALDAVANVFLGAELVRFRIFLRRRAMERATCGLLQGLQMQVASVREPALYLSGGQRSAVAIARVLNFKPQVVILDEPTAALDPVATERVLEIIKELAENGISVIVICHRFQDIFGTADWIVLLHLGHVAWDGPASELCADELLNIMKEAKCSDARR